jgi:hypothetical protein
MPGITKKPPESGSSTPSQGTEKQEGIVMEEKQAVKQQSLKSGKKTWESKVHQLSAHNKAGYTQKEQEQKKDMRLTVEQYLRQAKQDQGIADLIRSLYKMKAMSFAEWEREISALLKKKVK